MKTVAIYGGSFDPIHVGHLTTALYVKTTQGVDEVWFEPVYKHPAGKKLTRWDDRVSMASRAVLDFGPWAKVWEHELYVDRHPDYDKSGKTINLINYLQKAYPPENYKFKLILGSDALYHKHQWKEWDQINEKVEVVTLHRPGYPHEKAVGPALAEFSSTQIRGLVKEGKSIDHLVPELVSKYIATKGLYK